MQRTIEDINKKIEIGEANVISAIDFKEALRNDEAPSFEEVDVVTCGTCGVMSGTAAIFNIIVSEPGVFKKAKNIYLNGIPASVGPCPNELLGSVDCILNGTSHSRDNPEYGGGFLLKDLLNGKEIDVEVETIEGKIINSTTTLDDMVTAHMIGTRQAFNNYTAFVNTGDSHVKSIFDAKPFEPGLNLITFSGCGDINPLQNDMDRNVIKEGAKILLNGAHGLVLGLGTRASDAKPNLMLSADIKEMDSRYLGGYRTGMGPEVYDSVAIPIPILNEDIYNNLLFLNEDIPLTVADIRGRHLPVSKTNYGEMWNGAEKRPNVDESKCIACDECLVEKYCPTNAVKHYISDNKIHLDLNNDCFGCGSCAKYCIGNAFTINTGSTTINVNNKDYDVDIVSRQSDRLRAKEIINQLNDMILNKEFKL